MAAKSQKQVPFPKLKDHVPKLVFILNIPTLVGYFTLFWTILSDCACVKVWFGWVVSAEHEHIITAHPCCVTAKHLKSGRFESPCANSGMNRSSVAMMVFMCICAGAFCGTRAPGQMFLPPMVQVHASITPHFDFEVKTDVQHFAPPEDTWMGACIVACSIWTKKPDACLRACSKLKGPPAVLA